VDRPPHRWRLRPRKILAALSVSAALSTVKALDFS
jgi:hypothetical protein